VGHAYTAESMLEEKTEAIEGALYAALNSLEENALMSEGLAARARQTGRSHAAARFEARARGSRQQAETIRRVLVDGKSGTKETAF